MVVKQNDTMLKQLWLCTVKNQTHLILQECTVILAIDHCTNWHWMVKHKSVSAEEHDMHDSQSTLLCCAIFFLVMFGHAIQHSVFSAEGQMNASMTHQLLKCYRGMRCLYFSNSADGWWQEEHTWLLVIVEHMWDPLCTNLSFPQAVGEGMVNICWRDSDFCSNCCL